MLWGKYLSMWLQMTKFWIVRCPSWCQPTSRLGTNNAQAFGEFFKNAQIFWLKSVLEILGWTKFFWIWILLHGLNYVQDFVLESYASSLCFILAKIQAIFECFSLLYSAHYNRKKSIFEFIVSNILNEYRFHPKYPEKRLKIAAVLFGMFVWSHWRSNIS